MGLDNKAIKAAFFWKLPCNSFRGMTCFLPIGDYKTPAQKELHSSLWVAFGFSQKDVALSIRTLEVNLFVGSGILFKSLGNGTGSRVQRNSEFICQSGTWQYQLSGIGISTTTLACRRKKHFCMSVPVVSITDRLRGLDPLTKE